MSLTLPNEEIPEAPPVPRLPQRRYPSARAPIFNIPVSTELEQIIRNVNSNTRQEGEGQEN